MCWKQKDSRGSERGIEEGMGSGYGQNTSYTCTTLSENKLKFIFVKPTPKYIFKTFI